MVVVTIGTIGGGFSSIGPFANKQDAEIYMNEATMFELPYEVMELREPHQDQNE
jgi:hypothetical protein